MIKDKGYLKYKILFFIRIISLIICLEQKKNDIIVS